MVMTKECGKWFGFCILACSA